MCFSARASVVASGLLLAAGSSTWAVARARGDRAALPLALTPLLFGLQQGLEGLVWLGLEGVPSAAGQADVATALASLAYLFFAYALWPVWMPLAAVSLLERGDGRPGPWRWLPALGLVPGLLLWLPLLPHPRAAVPTAASHALIYPLSPWSEQLLPPLVGPALYAALIVLPLLLVPSGRVRAFAFTILLAFVITEWASREALTSLWCYASALLSGQILWILAGRAPAAKGEPPAPEPARAQA